MAAGFETSESFQITERQSLLTLPEAMRVGWRGVSYDATSDDQRFIVSLQVDEATVIRPPLILVENWAKEIRELVGR